MSDTSYRRGSPEIAAALRREILGGQLIPNERLPAERTLATRYGVARGTVRDALLRLADEALVEIRPGSGTYVRPTSANELAPVIANARPLELIDARFALEPHLCRLAVLHARAKELDTMEALLDGMDASVADPDAFALADRAFHTLLAESAGNNLLSWMISRLGAVREEDQWSRMRRLTLDPETIAHYNAQHRAIVEAIRAREPERAATAMKAHLESARLSLTRAAAA